MKHKWNSSKYLKTSNLQAGIANELINKLNIKTCENVLDIGCGLGNVTIEIAGIASSGKVVGIDTSSSMISHALQAVSKLSFFDSVGIGLFLQPLSEEERELLQSEIDKIVIESFSNRTIGLDFHRIYALASI